MPTESGGQGHLDERLGAFPVTELSPGFGPERLVGGGERARAPGSGERGGAGQRPALPEDLEIVIECQHLAALGHRPGMGGDDRRFEEHLHGGGSRAEEQHYRSVR